MPISTSDIEDIFNIPRDGRNIQDDSEEEVATGVENANVSFAEKVEELSTELSKKVSRVEATPADTKVETKPMPEPEKPKTNGGMFGDLFDDDEPNAAVTEAKPEPKVDPMPVVAVPEEVKAKVAEVIEEVKAKVEAEVKPKMIMPDPPEPAAVVDFDSLPEPEQKAEAAKISARKGGHLTRKVEVVEDVVTDDDDADGSGPCQEWTSSDEWLLDSPAPKYNRFYQEKRMVLRSEGRGILLGGQIDFGKYFNELADLNCDITVQTFDLEVIHQKMQLVQQLRERCKHIQLHSSQQYYLWERYIELFHGVLCRVEYERGKQDGLYYEHMRDMEHYYCSLKALHRNADQVMRTLDGAFECLSRQVTIAMPMREIERYAGPNPAPRQIQPEQKKFDALGAPAKSSVKPASRDAGSSGGIQPWA